MTLMPKTATEIQALQREMNETLMRGFGRLGANLLPEAYRTARQVLLNSVARREFTCPRCGQGPEQPCKMMFLGRWKTRFDAHRSVHDERITKALLVYGD